jgi:hypothetical protein
MIYTLANIKRELQENRNPIKIKRVYGKNSINNYELLEEVAIQLSSGRYILIPKGYQWDLSSVPRFLWWLLPPDGDFQMAALIHDYCYEYKVLSRKEADKEMYKWSTVTSGTNAISLRNIDNKLRLWGVQLFGWIVYNKRN